MHIPPETLKREAEEAVQRRKILAMRLKTAADTLDWLAKQPHITPGTARHVSEVAALCRANVR